MGGWLRRVRGALGMGVTWAVAWALAGILIGVASILLPWLPWDAFFRVFDAPLPALAIPGFFGGSVFSVVLGVAGRRHRFDELSLPRFAAWGAAGGLLLSLVPISILATALGTPSGAARLASVALALMPLATALGAISAAGTLALARRAEDRALLATGEEADDVGLGPQEARELLGRGD